MFFSDSRQHFFNPLTGKYRALVAECLRLLYQRLYTDLRDYGHAINREQLVDIFKEAIARAPILDADADADELKAFLKHVLPDFDEEKVYPSDIKKLVAWYKIIREHAPEVLEDQVENTEETKETEPEA